MLEPHDYFPPESTRTVNNQALTSFESLGKHYSFNSLGFRGAEFNPNAKLKLFAFGCSHTQGKGLNYDEIWTHRVAERFENSRQLNKEDICLMNFGLPGVSNDFITRTALRQCSLERPDVAIVQLTFMSRSELFLEDHLVRVSPWMNQSFLSRARYVLKHHRTTLRVAWTHLTKATALQRSRTILDDTMRTIQNILLLQDFFRGQRIQHAITWLQHPCLKKRKTLRDNQYAQPLIKQIRKDSFCNFGILDPNIKQDLAVDGEHVGPVTHIAFGDRLFEFLAEQVLET